MSKISVPTNSRGPLLELSLPTTAAGRGILITVKNVTSGKSLRLDLPGEWNGDDLTLDWHRKTITDQTGADRSSLLNTEHTALWDAEPPIDGEAEVTVEAAEVLEESQGLKSPSAVVNDASVGSKAWTNPTNAETSNNTYATALLASGQITEYLKATGYGFTIPEAGEILGVEASIEKSSNELMLIPEDYRVQLVSGGTIQGTNRAQGGVRWLPVDTPISYGGPTDLWGLDLTPSIVNASNFGIAVAAVGALGASSEPKVDAMRLEIYYRIPAAGAAYAATATLTFEQGYY